MKTINLDKIIKDNLYLIPGKHWVNRLFYVICNNEWTDENEEIEY